VSSRSWIEIDEGRLSTNYRAVREAAGGASQSRTDVLAVVKANAYGHGMSQCAVALLRAGATWLGVGDAAEGIRIRQALHAAGVDGNAVSILAMCGVLSDEAKAIAEGGVVPVVWTEQQVELLRGSGARVHVEVDTGMSRQGVRSGAALDALLGEISAAGLQLDGVLTHFHSAEVAGSAATGEQRRRFEGAVDQVRKSGFHPRWVHAGSSSTVDVGESPTWLAELALRVNARAMVRSGLALYGYTLPIARESAGPAGGGGAESHLRAKLKPVMTWKTRVLDVRDLPAGATIGYNATFTATQPMRVALLPVGYADGLRRELSSTNEQAGGWVMVRAADGVLGRAPILGRVSMNLTTVDITGVEGVRAGDEVVLLGDGITADDHARIAGTIPYEILCGVRA
jgi:alanine racemase